MSTNDAILRRPHCSVAARAIAAAAAALAVLLGAPPSLPASGGLHGTERSFAMGFTPFPHDGGAAGLFDALATIEQEGDLTVFHYDDGVPWNEALAGLPHPDRATLSWLRSLAPSGQRIYLAVTPIAISRDRLAPYWPNLPLTPPWDTLPFDDPAVVTAFTNHCEEMLALFQPDFFALSIEANLVHTLAPTKWAAWLSLAQQVAAALRASHPGLPLFATVQADEFWLRLFDPPDPTTGLTQVQAARQVVALSDCVAISSYPASLTLRGRVAELPPGYFEALLLLDPKKPFAIAETGWPGELLDAPWPWKLRTSALDQRDWVEALLGAADRHHALFVNWYLTRDYDALWSSGAIAQDALNRYFRDMGLKDGLGRTRPGLLSWRRWLAR